MTTTHDNPQAQQSTSTGTNRPAPMDPENDIDARSTTIWVLASSVVLFSSLYFMLPLFDRVLTQERNQKINQRPTLELDEVLEVERSFLSGELSNSKKSIDEVMRERASK